MENNQLAIAFKEFILEGYEKDELPLQCEKMCEQLCLEDKSEFGSYISDIELGTMYCPDEKLCEHYGFGGEVDMIEDIREIAEETGASFQKVNERLHEIAERSSTNGISGGFYGSGEIIFVDLEELKKYFS